MTSTVFHAVVLGGVEFQAFISIEGPAISIPHGRHLIKSAPLGPFTSIGLGRDGIGYAILKHRADVKIDVTFLSEAERERLGHEFGIETEPDEPRPFYESPAFEGLRNFVARHPRRSAKLARQQEHLKGWYDRAVECNRLAA